MTPKPVVPFLLPAISVAFSLMLGGCAESYSVQVDAISQATPVAVANPGHSYRIVSSNPKLDNASLHYKEVAGYIRTALSGKGMYEVTGAEKADVVVEIDYGMNQPRVKFQQIAEPVFEDSGGRNVTQTVNVTDPYTGLNSGPFQVTTYEPPKVTMVGMADRVVPEVVYEKYLNVSARRDQTGPEGRMPPEIWSVNVSAEDGSKDLRKYLPILASATADYIGSNTHEEKPVSIKEDADSVSFIKKGM